MEPAASILQTLLGLAPGTAEADVLRLLIQIGTQVTRAEEGSLLVYSERESCLRFAMTVGDRSSEAALLGQRVPMGEGITGLAAATQQVQIGAPKYKDIKQTQEREDQGGPNAVIAAPMLIGERLIGVVTAVSFKPDRRFGAEDARLIAGVATIAAVVVDQQQRLSAMTKGDAPGAPAAPGAPTASSGPEAAAAQRIVDTLSRIAADNPRRMPHIAAMLDALAAAIASR
jgi:GAF domain-containing protein